MTIQTLFGQEEVLTEKHKPLNSKLSSQFTRRWLSGMRYQYILARSELFKTALLSSAAALILVHNHPTGDPNLPGRIWVLRKDSARRERS